MRNALGPLSRAVFVLASLVLAPGCGGEAPPAPASGGARLFELQGCGVCHGSRGEGAMLGPSLRESEVHWTRATLAEYLSDPQAWVAKTPRLSATQQKYPAKMQPFVHLSAKERLDLADFVLALP